MVRRHPTPEDGIGLTSLTVCLRGDHQRSGAGGTMTLPGVVEHPKRSQDRLFKWVAAVAAACLIGFVVFVIVRGSPHPASVGSAALEAPPPPGPPGGHVGPGLLAPGAPGGGIPSRCRPSVGSR